MELTKVLVLRTAALGDFIMSLPALRAIRADFDGAELSLLTASGSERDKVAQYAKMGEAPWVELARPHLISDVIVLPRLSDARAMFALRERLRDAQFKAAIILCERGTPYRSRLKKWLLLKFLVGSVRIYGWRAKGSLDRSPESLERRGLLGHHVDGMFQYRRELFPDRKAEEDEIAFDIRPGDEAESWVVDWLSHTGWAGRCLIGIGPGALQPHKRWPLGNFKDLVGRLLLKYPNAVFAIFGTKADWEVGEGLKGLAPDRIANLAGQTTIAQSAALMGKMNLLVGNDGGAMHLGDAAGCKVVSIVPGIEYPNSIEPRQNIRLAVRQPVECAPCYNFVACPRGDNRCMTELSVEAVLENCEAALLADVSGKSCDSAGAQP